MNHVESLLLHALQQVGLHEILYVNHLIGELPIQYRYLNEIYVPLLAVRLLTGCNFQ